MDKIGRETINRLDRVVYEKRRRTQNSATGFPFVGKVETLSSKGTRVPPHLHFYLGLDLKQSKLLEQHGDRMGDKFARSLREREYHPDFHLQVHNGKNVSYIMKNADHDLLGIFSRSHPLAA
ncbi:hypothetical protein KC887_09070 [Candidatus Kaiserbacteria bacterium]|nr:hypothetical protein [Candidatus Kaiserbacteria bacterium]